MGQDGIPVSLAMIIASAVLGALLLVGMLLLGLFQSLVYLVVRMSNDCVY